MAFYWNSLLVSHPEGNYGRVCGQCGDMGRVCGQCVDVGRVCGQEYGAGEGSGHCEEELISNLNLADLSLILTIQAYDQSDYLFDKDYLV